MPDVGDLVQTTVGTWITPPTDALPERPTSSAPIRPWWVTRRASVTEAGTHHLDVPHMRSDGVRAAAQHSLLGDRRPAAVRISTSKV